MKTSLSVGGLSLVLCFSASAAVRYVDLFSPGPVAPFTSWTTAATNIQDAVDAAVAGDEILVTNGWYATGGRPVFGTMTNRVVVDKAVSVRSVNGPQFTLIQGSLAPGTVFGESAIRCVYLTNGASLTGFTLTNGATHSSGNATFELSGGGVWCNSTSAVVANCIIAGNHAQVRGGGAYGGTLNNCLFYGNSSTNAGATFSNVLNNCTIVGNSSIFGAGGVHSATLNNSIVYFNTGFPANYQQCTINYSCTTPQPAAGSGNITADPMLVDWLSGNFQLYPASPCVNAGNNALAPAGTDLAGNGRIFAVTVDLGAYECRGDVTNAAGLHYVATNSPNPVPPYTSWATAALTIQDAIDVAVAGDEIVVTNGVYASGGRAVGTIGNNRVAVDKAVTVRSVNGPQFTFIQGFQVPGTTLGPGAVRCVYLATNAVISGFTLTNGATLDSGPTGSSLGGGVYCETRDGVVLNCVLAGNAAMQGGGAYRSSLKNCLLTGNSSYDGGGAWLSALLNCTVVRNSASSAGGGGYDIYATNCIVYSNAAPVGLNYYGPNGAFGYSCTFPLPSGTGNTASDPRFVNLSGGNYRLQSSSPCINTGNNQFVTGLDLDGNSRIVGSLVDMGAYEYQGATNSVAPSIIFHPTNQTVTVGSNASFMVVAGGSSPLSYQWLSNAVPIAWATNFFFTVTNAQLSYSGTLFSVTVTNLAGSMTSSNALLAVLPAPISGTRYVDANSANPAPPYTTWATAARTIQDAVDAALAGDDIVVTNGVYATGGRALYGTMTNRLAVTNAVWVRSVNGPQFTIIEGRQVPGTLNGDGAIRCVQLNHSGARLSGFTLRNGATRTGGDMNNEQCGGGLLIPYGISAVASNCIIVGNASATLGGGVQRGTLYNCALYRNTCGYAGGAAYESTMVNCTVVGNVDNYGAGGMYGGSSSNCIVYFNQPANHSGGRMNFCCTTPMPYSWQGSANITADPQLASFTHLSLGSPCRSAGNGSVTRGTDLDGEVWRSPPAIGCDEINPGAATGALTVDLTATLTSVTPLYTVSFTALIEGRTTASVWDFGDGVTLSNQPFATHFWTQAGDYPVVLTAYNDSNPAGVSATFMVHVVSAPIHYVFAGNVNPAAPYSSWATAATNIQDAIDAATIPGAMVLVSNGVYSFGGKAVHGTMTNRVAVTKALAVRSVNGPAATVIQGWQLPVVTNGDGAIRCAYLTNGASLAGFTLTGGATQTNGDYSTQIVGGGVWCLPGATLSNCVVQGNSAADSGGGAYRGLLVDCQISDNLARYGGGCYNSTLTRCTLTRNVAWTEGGGGYGSQFGQSWLTDNVAMGDGGGACNSVLTNCAVVGNTATNGGGLFNSYGGQVFGCTVVSNSAVNGGGVYGFTNVTYYNSIIYFNSAATGSNYAGSPYDGFSTWFYNCCTAPLTANAYNSIDKNPLLVDLASRNLRLQSTSPCVEAGNNSYAFSSVDLDGLPRIVGERVDIGAYEFPDILAPYIVTEPADQTITESLNVTFTVVMGGTGPFGYLWRFNGVDIPGETNASLTLNQVQVSDAGLYSVEVSNSVSTVASREAMLTVNAAVTHYVDAAAPNPEAPYLTWETAARTIQAAVDVAVGGDDVVVTNGLYASDGRAIFGLMTNRVAVDKPLRIRSVNGPQFTTIQGQQAPGTKNGDGAIRCVYLTNGASLWGFTLTNGATRNTGDTVYELSGGGLLSNSGVVSNCVFTGNSAYIYGGGVYGGTFYNCLIVSNSAGYGGGGAGDMFNCTVVGNLASSQGGGTWGGRYKNCIIYYNSAPNSPNSIYGSQDYCCIPSSGANNITVPPLFLNQSAGDFRLQSGSPCINAGSNYFAPAGTDLAGYPRIRGTAVDIGAFEFQDSQPVLGIVGSGGGIRLYWPLWASDFGLQEIGAIPLNPGGWSNLNVSPSTSNSVNSVFQPLNGELKFYRLHRP